MGCSRGGRSLRATEDAFHETVVADFRTRTSLTETMRLQMSVELLSREEKNEARLILTYKRPDKFRLQVLDPMNVTRVVVAAKGDWLRLFYVREFEGIEAPLRDDVLRRLFRMDIRVSDVRTALVVDPFVESVAPPTHLERRDGHVLLGRPSTRSGYMDEMTLEEFQGQTILKEWRIKKNGDTEQIAQFEKYREVGGILRPMDITIERPKEKTRLHFRVSEAEVNLPLSDAVFELAFPPSAKVERLR